MSPIPFGTPPYELTLPSIDVTFIGSVMLTIWQIVTTSQVLIVIFWLAIAAGLLSWLISFVTRRHAAHLATGNIKDIAEDIWED